MPYYRAFKYFTACSPTGSDREQYVLDWLMHRRPVSINNIGHSTAKAEVRLSLISLPSLR